MLCKNLPFLAIVFGFPSSVAFVILYTHMYTCFRVRKKKFVGRYISSVFSVYYTNIK